MQCSSVVQEGGCACRVYPQALDEKPDGDGSVPREYTVRACVEKPKSSDLKHNHWTQRAIQKGDVLVCITVYPRGPKSYRL